VTDSGQLSFFVTAGAALMRSGTVLTFVS
jgi:hypothetical protein